MTLSVVQSTGAAIASQSAAFTLTGSPAAGNILVAFIGWNEPGGAPIVTPSGTWTQVFYINGGSNDSLSCYWYLVKAGDGTSWTFTDGYDDMSGAMYEITGQASSPVNGSNTSTFSSPGSSVASASVTPSVTGCLPLAGMTDDSATVSGVSTSGWTLKNETGAYHGSAGAYGPLTTDTVTAISCTFTYTSTGTAGATGTVLIAPGGNIPGPPLDDAPVPVNRPVIVTGRAGWRNAGHSR